MIPVLALACILLGATTRISIEAFIGRIYYTYQFLLFGWVDWGVRRQGREVSNCVYTKLYTMERITVFGLS